MPLYKVTSPDGRAVTLRGDIPPNDQDLDQVFSSLPQKSEVKSPSIIDKFGTGGIGYGAEAVKQGLNFKDVPNIAAKAVSGAFQGLPERISKNPIKFGLAGPTGASVWFQPPEKNQLPFPQPNSEGGRMIGDAAELVTSSLPLEGAVSPVSKFGEGADFTKRFGQIGGKTLQKARQLSGELYAQADEARKTAGAMQGGYIDANEAEKVDPERFQQTIDALPKGLQDAIHNHPDVNKETVGQIDNGKFVMGKAGKQVSPQITRVRGPQTDVVEPTFDPEKGGYAREIVTPRKVLENPEDIVALHQPGEGTTPRQITSISPKETYSLNGEKLGPGGLATEGKQVISPTLKNAETIRGIIKGKVPSNYFNPRGASIDDLNAAEQGYQNIGQIMTQGRPELNEAMQNYGSVSRAAKQIRPNLVSNQGMTKTQPILTMFGNKAKGENLEAIQALAEHNPDILNTVDRARRFGKGVERTNTLKRVGKKAALYATLGALGLERLRQFH